MEFIFEVIFLMLVSIPGAIFRWALGGFKKPLSYYFSLDSSINSNFGFLLIIILCGIYVLFRVYIWD
jgi:hypothetical protein